MEEGSFCFIIYGWFGIISLDYRRPVDILARLFYGANNRRCSLGWMELARSE